MPETSAPETSAMEGLRRRGQFLISGLMWSATAGLLALSCGYALVMSRLVVELAEHLRSAAGFAAPRAGADWFSLLAYALLPSILLLVLGVFLRWYKRVWMKKLYAVWPDNRERGKYSRWTDLPTRASEPERSRRTEYLDALMRSHAWMGVPGHSHSEAAYEARAELLLLELEKDIAERALTTGLTVGVSHNRYIDLFTIFVAALELQLHVLTRLGKRPSFATWRLLIQRCGASLFINGYLNRQDSLALNLMIKKAGMGLQAAGDLVGTAAQHLSASDIDLDEALNLQHSGILGIATKGLELGATMALSVGQVGLHVLGTLIESAGDELAQGALAAGIIYHHGMSLAADALAIDSVHRASPAMNRGIRDGIWKMGEIAGSILRDIVRQRRSALRDKRQQIVTSLPKGAYARVRALFGKKSGDALDNIDTKQRSAF